MSFDTYGVLMKTDPIIAALPKIDGPVKVTFKDEGTVQRKVCGPVIIEDLNAREAAGNPKFWKFGETPVWMHVTPWQTRTVAKQIAEHYGVKLEEA